MSHSQKQTHDHGVVQSEWNLPLIKLAKSLIKLSQFPQLQNGKSFLPPGDNMWILLAGRQKAHKCWLALDMAADSAF